jgi:hypothetical protein
MGKVKHFNFFLIFKLFNFLFLITYLCSLLDEIRLEIILKVLN